MPDKSPFYFKNYTNVVDYVHEYGNLSFQEENFNDIDALVFSIFAYFPLEETGIPFQEMSVQDCCINFLSWVRSEYISLEMAAWFRKFLLLGMALLNKKRYKDLLVKRFEYTFSKEKETQFAALEIELDEKRSLIAYRGTDRTLVGWKENLNLAANTKVGSYLKSKDFLLKAIEGNKDKSFYVVGHSKGGHLAAYAASCIPSKDTDKILCIYNFDGPGFGKEIFESEGYKQIQDKIKLLVPQFDVIGTLLYHNEPAYIIDAQGYFDFFIQHDPFTWKVEGKEFVKVKERTPQSKYIDKVLQEFVLEKVDPKDLKPAIDVIFAVIDTSGFTDALQIERNVGDAIAKFLSFSQKQSKQNRKILTRLSNLFISCAMHHLPSYNKDVRIQREEIKKGKEEERNFKKDYDKVRIK